MLRRSGFYVLMAALAALALPTGANGQVSPTDPPGRGAVEGAVTGRQSSSAYPLPHVLLQLARGRDTRTAVSDSAGRYRVDGLAPGLWRVHAVHVGHETLSMDILVPGEGSLVVDMELSSRPILLDPVRVMALPLASPLSSEAPPLGDLGEISLRSLEGSTGMVESGLAQVVRALPGRDQAEPTDVLLMRGSAADLKLVLLDGAPVYTPFHLGGLVESFDPQALGRASLFLGGAPAHFDGGLSYIMDLQTRRPREDRLRLRAGADLMTSRMLVEGPALGGGLMIGSRMIHDLGTAVLGRGDSPYGYGDLVARGAWGEPRGHGAFITGFWNRETVRLDLAQLSHDQGAAWGNMALSTGVHGTLGKAFSEIRGAVSRYEARLPVADSIPLFATSRTRRIRITGDLSHPWGPGSLRLGGVLDHMASDYNATGVDEEGNPVASALAVDGTTLGFYGEGSREVGSSVQLRGGLRLDHFSQESGVRLAPRMALSWLLTDNAVLTLAAGRYHQLSSLSSAQVEESLSEGANAPQSSASSRMGRLTVGTADHLVMSLDQILLPGLRLGIEGYMKRFSGVLQTSGPNLNASGVDLRVAREGERASGWLGYTLTWFWASGDGFLGQEERFSGRHLLSAGLSTRISQRTGLRIRVGYGDGLPYTSIPIFPGEAGDNPALEGPGGLENRFELDGDNLLNQAPGLAVGPDQGFLRVEGELFAEWRTALGGTPLQLRPYLRVLNALNRRDALFYHFEPWRSSHPRPLAEMPVLPLLGVEVIF